MPGASGRRQAHPPGSRQVDRHRHLDLSITSQMLRVEPDGTGRILPAHVGCRVDPDGSRRLQKDRLDDQTDDQAHSILNRMAT
jgi:hypothetical protein